MAEMSITGRTQHLSPDHAVAGVLLGLDIVAFSGLPKTRPAGTRVELVLGGKQSATATFTSIKPGRFRIDINTRECAFRSVLATYMVFLRGQNFPPFGLAALDFLNHYSLPK